jgi:amidohydrolase
MAGSLTRSLRRALLLAFCLTRAADAADISALDAEIDRGVRAVEARVVAWRRDIHQHPELSNRETRTAKLVADHLRHLGLQVKTGVAHTGVVGLLRGARAEPVVALRADMDALPVTEEVDVPFRSKVRATYNGQEVGVMHACGHDAHVAILMGVAEVLAGMRERVPGSVKFIFQPAEEGAPAGEEGGAGLMVREGVLDTPRPGAIFGLHVYPYPAGTIAYRAGPTMAGSDGLRIVVRGRQTHGAQPWRGVDPIVVAAQIVTALQTITSRQVDITRSPAVVTIGSIQGGVRGNIIPDDVEMSGTIRTFDATVQEDIHRRIRRTVESVAESAGATAEVTIGASNPVTTNDPGLTERMTTTLARVAGAGAVVTPPLLTVAEDFAYYQRVIPGLFFFIGAAPPGVEPGRAEPNHSPRFVVDESALPLGMRALAYVAVEYLASTSTTDGQ